MSAKGLEWARRLRAELEQRIEGLREALAGIEPLRVELARLEEQLKGVNRLIGAYENDLGYLKSDEAAHPPVLLPAAAAQAPQLAEPALVPVVEHKQPTLVDVLRAEARALVDAVRDAGVASYQAAARTWLIIGGWLSERFSRSSSLS